MCVRLDDYYYSLNNTPHTNNPSATLTISLTLTLAPNSVNNQFMFDATLSLEGIRKMSDFVVFDKILHLPLFGKTIFRCETFMVCVLILSRRLVSD